MSTILVVDDELAVRQVLHAILSDEGHHVLLAAHGGQALDILTTVVVDCLISDLMMPIVAGTTLLATLRDDPRFAALPVVLMSAAPPPPDLRCGPHTRFWPSPGRSPSCSTL